MFENFERSQIDGDGCRINVIHGSTGPAVLLLHGYPQNHVEWHKVAPRLATHFSVVCPDLRGMATAKNRLQRMTIYQLIAKRQVLGIR